MADITQENTELSPAAATAEAAPARNTPQAMDQRLKELHANRFEKKGARRAFHLVNFLGLHQIFNNVSSVVITYALATTGLATKMKDSMAHGPVGKSLSTVLTAPSKLINFVFEKCGADLNRGLNSLSPELKNKELLIRAADANRNAIETAFMTIAGFIALAPVWYLENHRAEFLNKVDNWLHPNRSKEEKEAAALKPGDEPKETWWNLIRARLVALAVVFGIDQVRTNFDSIIKYNHKSANKEGMYKNIDTTFGWGLGNKIYNKLPENVRGWLARFFSGSLKGKNITLSSMQSEVRDEVLKVTDSPAFVMEASKEMSILEEAKRAEQIAVGFGKKSPTLTELENKIAEIDRKVTTAKGGLNAVERAVFSEQSRLFITKEVFLTTILSAVIYFCAKSSTAAKFFEKIGLQKKGAYEKEHMEREARKNGNACNNTHAEPEGYKEQRWSSREENRPKKSAAEPPPATYADKLAAAQTEAQPQVAM